MIILYNSADCELQRWSTWNGFVADINNGYVSPENGDRIEVRRVMPDNPDWLGDAR